MRASIYRAFLLALVVAAFLIRPQAPRDLTTEEIDQLRSSVDMRRELSKHGPQTFVMHGETEGVSWDLYVRSTPIGLCVIVVDPTGPSQSCGFSTEAAGMPVVAFRMTLAKRIDATHIDRVHLVVGIVPRRSRTARVAFEGGSPTINPQIVVLPGINVAFFVAQVPRRAGAAVVEAFDAIGNSLGRWGVPQKPSSGAP